MPPGREPARFRKLDIDMLKASFFLVGLAMVAFWFVMRKKAQATSHWPSTPGRVITSDVYVYRDADMNQNETVRVAYDYAVAGATLRGTRISLTGSGSGSTKVKLARYRPGAAVNVFYDPHNPSSAVLECKLPGNMVVLPIMGTFFFGAGVFMALANL